jgi:hypothetical protein
VPSTAVVPTYSTAHVSNRVHVFARLDRGWIRMMAPATTIKTSLIRSPGTGNPRFNPASTGTPTAMRTATIAGRSTTATTATAPIKAAIARGATPSATAYPVKSESPAAASVSHRRCPTIALIVLCKF